MRLRLDTHDFLWFIDDNSQLSKHARVLIEDDANEVLLSVASVWGNGNQDQLEKVSAKQRSFKIYTLEQLRLNGIALLNITLSHTAEVLTLLFHHLFHHRDPFDRLLITQARIEAIPLVSANAAFDPYPITRLWWAREPIPLFYYVFLRRGTV